MEKIINSAIETAMEKTKEPTPYSAMKQTIDALQDTTSLIKGKTP